MPIKPIADKPEILHDPEGSPALADIDKIRVGCFIVLLVIFIIFIIEVSRSSR
jgi:hypothetical protein